MTPAEFYVSSDAIVHLQIWLSLIAGLDCGLDHWTGLLDWIAGLDSEDVRLACKTACVVKSRKVIYGRS